MIFKPIASIMAVSCVMVLLSGVAFGLSPGDSLLANDVFAVGFDGWTDTHVVDPADIPPSWGVLLGDDDALCEANNIITGANTTARRNDAISQKMINMNYTTATSYTLTGNVGTWDDDGYGLVFGYVDESNYYRVGVRQQLGDTFGFPGGISITKVVGGTQTLLGQDTTPTLPYKDGVYYDLSVTVDGTTGAYSVDANPGGGAMVNYLSGVDAGLVGLGGHYGVHSWAQKEDANSEASMIKNRGTCVKTVTVDDGSDSVIDRVHTFADATPVSWRALEMTNGLGYQGDPAGAGSGGPEGFNYGNFRLDFRNGTIFDESNGFVWATTAAPAVDFIGPAITIDEVGSESWDNYDLNVRVETGDNEGPGVLVRVQDDNTFYRVNFATQTSGDTRAPQGMSIQKCVDDGENPPIWTELYTETVDPFLYTYDQPFDLKVRVSGNGITVSLIDDPDGAATEYTWDTVYDTSDPIVTGSVGLTNWGAGDETNGVYFSAYGGGDEGDPAFVTAIPEPSSMVLLSLLALFGLARRRRS